MSEKRKKLIKELLNNITMDWLLEMVGDISKVLKEGGYGSDTPLEKILWVALGAYVFGYHDALETEVKV